MEEENFLLQKDILEQELAMADSPTIIPFGVTMIGPVLIQYGTEKQKDFFLPKILNLNIVNRIF